MKILTLFLICCLSFLANGQDNQFKRIASQDDILFESGKFEVPLSDFLKIDSLLAIFKIDDSYQFLLTAHTDADGSAQSNLILSKKRSAVVKEYLLSKGVSPDKIKIYDFGEGKPLTSNADEAGKRRNRRVTVEVVKYYPLVKLTGKIGSSSGPVPNAKIFVKSSIYRDSAISNADGSYQIYAIDNLPARISVVAQNHLISSKIVKIKSSDSGLDFDLVMAVEGEVNELKDLFFYGDEARILPTSAAALEDLVLFMEMNPSFEIEIMGHVNVPGTEMVKVNSSFFTLSVSRALAIRAHLVKKGIESRRLLINGYGNSKMKFPNPKTEAQAEANRRVEIKLLKK